MSLRAKFQLLRGDFRLNADLDLPADAVTAFFGPSGCGKTSLLRAIAGLDHHPHSFLQVGEQVWQDKKTFLPPHQRAVGYVFQESSLFEHLSVGGNLAYARKRAFGDTPHFSQSHLTHLLGLENLMHRRPPELSGGERRRVSMARALSVNPRLLLFDEPMSGLDAQRKKELFPYFDTLHEELRIPILYVSHSADEVARLADYLVFLEGGAVAGSGSIQDMLTRLDLPLAAGPDAESLIEGTVKHWDKVYGLAQLQTAAGSFSVVHPELPCGARVRLGVAAKDVSLTLNPQSDTSILNRFPATVEALTVYGTAQMTVRLQVGDALLLARVTRKSADTLGLQTGQSLYAQVKSVALLF